MVRWLLLGTLFVAAALSVGLDAASLPQVSQIVDLVSERAITPALEAQWSRGAVVRATGETPRQPSA